MRRSWSRGRLAVLIASTAAAAVTVAGNPATASAAPAAPRTTPSGRTASAAVNTPATAVPAVVPDAAAGAPGAVEVPSMRTETSRTDAVPGVGYRTTVSGTPLHYRDAKNAWQPIDTTLVVDGSSWTPKAASWSAELPATLGSAPIRVLSGTRWVSLAPTGAAAVRGVAKGSRITYAEAYPGVSLVYDALPTGLKESILLSGPAARSSFSFGLKASAGLTATAKDGAVTVTDSGGATVFGLPAGFVADAKDATSDRAAVATSLSSAASLSAAAGSGLTTTIAPSWLSAPSRTWPVTLDPTVVVGADKITDCNLVNGYLANTTQCNIDVLEFGFGPATVGSVIRRLLMKFDLSAIPKSAVIKTADIKLVRKDAGQPAATVPIQAMRVARDWTTAATWNTSGVAGGAWTGGVFGPTQIDTVSVNNQAAETHVAIPYLTQLWVQGVQLNQGVELMSTTETTNGFARFASSTNADAAARPTFTVDWVVQQGQRDTNTFVSKPLSDRCSVGGNVGNGNLLLQCTELSIAGVGQPVTVSRYYNSGPGEDFLSRADAPLGINRWKLSTGVYLVPRANSVDYTDGSGAVFPFHQLGGTAFRQVPSLGASLEKDQPAAGQYRMKFHSSGAQFIFKKTNARTLNATYQLFQIKDKNGNTVEFGYTDRAGYDEGALSTIKDTRGRLITIGYTPDSGSGKDFLTSITDSSGRHANFAYTGWQLTTATDMDGDTTTYGYANFGTQASQLSSFTDARGHATQFGYDTNGRVVDITQHPAAGQNANSHFTYNDTVSPPTTTVRDPNLNNTVYEIEHKDYASRATKATDAKGKSRSRSFTSNAKVGTVTDELDNTTTNTYGQNLADSGDATSGESLTKSVGPSGSTSLAEYSSATGASCPTGATKTGSGFTPICSRDDAGNKSSYTYDGPGNLSQNKNALAATSKVDRAVSGSGQTPTDGRVVKATDPLGRVTTYAYADVTFNATTTKRLSTITAPGGSLLGVRTFTYDGLDRQKTYTTGRSTTVTLTYDGSDRVTDITYSDTTAPVHNTYDGNGNLTQRVDGTGTTTYSYDFMNRLTAKTLPGPKTLSYTYDPVGNLKTSVQDGGTTSYDYDTVNQVTRMTERSGRITRFAYRADGKRTDTWYNANTTDPPSTFAAHVHVDFDPAGRISRLKETRASSDADANRILDSSYCYRPRSVTGATCTTAKDETNDRAKLQWEVNNIPGGATVQATYDGAGRLVKRQNLTSGTVTDTAYDANGNRTSEKESGKADRFFGFTSGNAMCWTASVAGTTTGCTPPAGAQTTWTYDGAGNQTVNPDATATYNGTEQTSGITVGGTTTPFGYASDKQTERTTKGGTSYVNGLLGVQSETTAGATTYYERDPSGQLVSERTPAGDFYYLFDRDGSVRALVDPAGLQRVAYAYSSWGDDRGTTAMNGTLPPNPYRFKAEYLDSQTGLYKMGLRYYSPKYARWTQQDTIESIGDPANGNRYAFGGDDPVNNADPTGASWISDGANGLFGQDRDAGRALEGASVVLGYVAAAAGPTPVGYALTGLSVVTGAAGGYAKGDSWSSIGSQAAFSALSFGGGKFLSATRGEGRATAWDWAGAAVSNGFMTPD